MVQQGWRLVVFTKGHLDRIDGGEPVGTRDNPFDNRLGILVSPFNRVELPADFNSPLEVFFEEKGIINRYPKIAESGILARRLCLE